MFSLAAQVLLSRPVGAARKFRSPAHDWPTTQRHEYLARHSDMSTFNDPKDFPGHPLGKPFFAISSPARLCSVKILKPRVVIIERSWSWHSGHWQPGVSIPSCTERIPLCLQSFLFLLLFLCALLQKNDLALRMEKRQELQFVPFSLPPLVRRPFMGMCHSKARAAVISCSSSTCCKASYVFF